MDIDKLIPHYSFMPAPYSFSSLMDIDKLIPVVPIVAIAVVLVL